MRVFLIIFVLLLFDFCSIEVLGQVSSCSSLSNSVCSNVLTYSSVFVKTANGNCSVSGSLSNIENSLTYAPSVWSSINDSVCRSLFAQLQCRQSYPPCPSNSSDNTVDTLCGNIYASCSPSDISFIKSIIPLPCTVPLLPVLTVPSVPIISCEPYPSSGVCSNILSSNNYMVYTGGGYSFFGSDFFASQFSFLFPLITRDLQACPLLLQEYICSSLHPRCYKAPVIDPFNKSNIHYVPLPQRLCTDNCFSYFGACFQFFIQFASLAPAPSSSSTNSNTNNPLAVATAFLQGTCTYTDGQLASSCNKPSLYVPTFSNGAQAYTVGNLSMNVPCNSFQVINSTNPYISSGSNTLQVSNPPVTCPDPLFVSDYTDITIPANAYCTLPCPFPGAPKSDVNSVATMQFVLSTISVACSLFLLLTWFIFPVKRSQRYVRNFTVCTFIISVFLFFAYSTAPDISRIGCKDAGHIYGQWDNFYCTATGVVTIYFALALMFWWSFIAVDLYMRIVNMSSNYSSARDMFFNGYAWGMPAVLISIGFGNLEFGGLGGTPCQFNGNALPWVWWVLWYVPILVHMALTTFIIIIVLYHTQKAARESRGDKNARGCCGIKHLNPRIMLFLAQMFILVTCILSIGIPVTVLGAGKDSKYFHSVTDWVTCLLSYGGSKATCGEFPTATMPFWTNYVYSFGISAQGILNFIAYGTQASNYILWYNFILCRGRQGTTIGGSKGSSSNTSKERSKDSRKSNLTSPSNRKSYLKDKPAMSTETSSPLHTHRTGSMVQSSGSPESRVSTVDLALITRPVGSPSMVNGTNLVDNQVKRNETDDNNMKNGIVIEVPSFATNDEEVTLHMSRPSQY